MDHYAEREKAIREEAENLAAQMLDQELPECPETGVKRRDITGVMDDYDLYDEAVFKSAVKRPMDLYSMLLMTATRVIERELKKRPSPEEQRAIDWHEQRKQLKRGIA